MDLISLHSDMKDKIDIKVENLENGGCILLNSCIKDEVDIKQEILGIRDEDLDNEDDKEYILTNTSNNSQTISEMKEEEFVKEELDIDYLPQEVFSLHKYEESRNQEALETISEMKEGEFVKEELDIDSLPHEVFSLHKYEEPRNQEALEVKSEESTSKMNLVSNLLLKDFSLCSAKEKLEIKNLGRSTPPLKIEQIVKSKNRRFKRIFNLSTYNKHKWICGCEEKNTLHCFPCLLFGGEDTWTKIGVKDMNHLSSKAKHHENSKVHMKNVLSLSLFGKLNIAKQLDSEYRKSILKHNENVKNNRYILNIIVNCIKFCGAFELALRGHNEAESSTTPGDFRGLVNFSAEIDNSLKVHLEKATIFKGASKTLQNELLQIMLEICHEEIVKEIHEADFLSVIADEMSDVSNIYQMVVIFRYIVKGRPTERFWNFIAPEKHDTETFTTCLLKEIERLGINDHKDKLISQTYDGAIVMGGSSGGVQAKLRQMYPKAEYIHCYAHQLNLVMLNAASVNRNVRIFFANLQAICAFFSTSPKRTAVLDQIVNRRLPNCSIPTRWNFHSRSVNIVFAYIDEIKKCLNIILNEDKFQDVNTISLASVHVEVLESNNFNFWLSFFRKIMSSIDILYGKLQKRNIDLNSIKICIDTFERNVLSIRESFNFQETADNIAKQREMGVSDLSREAKEICDTIICQIKDRFKFTGHLIAATLFLPEMFANYNSKFPEKTLNETCKAYPLLDIKKLQTELSLIYSTEEFRSMPGAVALLDFISENKLEDSFSECLKILKILITIPMTTSEAERCSSTLERIKTFVRNTMGQDRLSALAMLSMEKDFIINIWDFNHRVIEKFAHSKEWRADFLFK